ncbi:dehydroquinate synthase/iron-containing alcohol dehydrogenase family protein [Thalassoroseus pseudoceratinae]|uniref:iron-containing alcohol dehydrogenase n=1 Tax=Thalassoroseus pseudoceratinae TaxID=2713176 RepID=UPI0014240483|nr:iron-containing alcohol dehydrogenase [Thalassoroseus pseudoceratinae]
MQHQTVKIEAGAARSLGAVVPADRPLNIFAIDNQTAYAVSGAEEAVADFLSHHQPSFFRNLEPNPKVDDVLRGIQRFRDGAYDIVLAIDGGSARVKRSHRWGFLCCV